MQAVKNNEIAGQKLTHKRNKVRHPVLTVTCALLVLLVILLVGLLVGAEPISIASLFSKDPMDAVAKIIVFDIRLPRLLLASLCGVLLAGAGTVFQGFFRNPLADSGIMGISSGATLGAVLSIFLPLAIVKSAFINPIVIFAFIGALATAMLVYILSYRCRGMQGTIMMLLTGTALASFFSAIVSIILLIRYQELHQIYVWTLGSFNARGWNELKFIIIPSIFSLVLLFLCARSLDVLSGGEESAQSLGVDLKKTRLLTLSAGSLACACAVSAAGTIGFIGLIAPHIARRLYGAQHARLLPFSMLWGAILLVLSDTIARTSAAPSELPVGIVTALMRDPFFMFVIQKRRGFSID